MVIKVKGCCCMSLRTAGLVLGWLGIAASAISIFKTITYLESHDFDEAFVKNSKLRPGDVMVFFLTASLLNVIISGLLINGITVSKHRMLLPWLIIKGIGLVITIPFVFLIFGYALMSAKPVAIAAGTFLGVIFGFCCFCWIVVYSLYKEIRMIAQDPLPFNEKGQVGTTPPYQVFTNENKY